MNQRTLFDPAPKHVPHSPTSRQAAAAIERDAKSLRGTVYRYLISCGSRGATDAEMQDRLGMNPSTQRPRRIELVEKGLVRDSETTRKTPSGRAAAVWVVTEKAEA